MTDRDDAELVIEALYQVAANPAAWEQLVAALDPDGLEDPPASAAVELRRTPEIARLQAGPGEGVGSAGGSGLGWVVLGATGRVMATDPTGREALAGVGGVAEADGTLRFCDPLNDEAVGAALSAARGGDHPVILRLGRRDFDGPGFAYVAAGGALPAFAAASAPEALAQRGAVALIFPPSDAAARLWSSVRASFGLTAAEVRLAQRLRDGRSVSEAARDLGVSVNTVRNQVRGIFDKMGLQRQSELVAALADLTTLTGALEAEGRASAPAPLAEAPAVRFVLLDDGRRLAYREYGDPRGQPLLSFHEGMGSSLLPAGSNARATALGLRILAVDRPGFGRSDPLRPYSFQAVAGDMVAFCDRLGLDRVRVGAVLSGAAAALHTAVRLGERAEMVFLCSGRPPRRSAEGHGPGSPLTQFRARLQANPWVVEAFYTILRIRLSHRMTRSLVRRTAAHSPGDQAWLAAHPEFVDYAWACAAEALGSESHGPVAELKAFREAPPLSLAGLRAPVVVWHGREDTMVPPSDILAYLGPKASEVRVLDDVGVLMTPKHWDEILQRAAASPPA